MNLSVVLLAKNESENLRILIPEVQDIISKMGLVYEIIIVGANETDGTCDVCKEFNCEFILQSKPGFGIALREGLHASRGERILTLDADLQHDPSNIPNILSTEADLVIGSRWVGRKEIHIPIHRRILSLGVNVLFSGFLGISVRDTSSNFRLYSRNAIRGISIEGKNFNVLQEILIKIINNGFVVKEIPMNFKPRERGESNLSLPIFLVSYFLTFLKLLNMRIYHTFAYN